MVETAQPSDSAPDSATPHPRVRAPRLRDCRDARRLLAATYAAFVRGEIDRGAANTRTFMLATFGRIVADSAIEERIAALEAAAALETAKP